MSRKLSRFLFAGLLLLGASCGEEAAPGDADDGGATAIEVDAAEFSFNPPSIDASAGEEIELTLNNTGMAPHTFTIDDVVDVEAAAGEQATATFTAPDAPVEFYCSVHPTQMRGELTIDGQSAGGDGGDTGGGDTDDDLDY